MNTPATKPLRITIAAGPFFPTPPAPTGAVQRAWYDLALRFARRGHHVEVVAVRHEGQPAEETVEGVHIVRRLSMKQGRNIWIDLAKDLVACLLTVSLLPKADVVVTNSFWMPLVARLRGRSIGKIYVSIGRFPKGQIKLYRSSHRLHAVSKAIEESILAEDPTSGPRIRILPYPIATEVFQPPASPRASTGERTILYTGRIHPEKGVHLLVEAFASLRTTRPWLKLRLVGPSAITEGGGGEPYLARLKGLIGELPVEIMPPIYGRQALAAELHAAHFYCYPSLAERGESFGVAPLEAMATGLPVVVSNLACFRDFVRPGENGLVFDHRASNPAEKLGQELARLIDDPALAARMGDAGASTATAFGYEQVADAYLADFRDLVGT